MRLLLLGLISTVVWCQSSPFQWNGFILTGQSLAEGYNGNPPLSTTQPYANLQLTLDGSCHYPTALPTRALIEDSQPDGCAFSTYETLGSAMANNLTAFSPSAAWVQMVSRNGLSGADYNALKKGTTSYNKAMAATTGQIAVEAGAASTASKTFGCVGVIVTHGETDFATNHLTADAYEADLVQWQADYETDCKTRTGQTRAVPIYIDQMHSWTHYSITGPVTSQGSQTGSTPIGQWQAYRDNPTKIFLSGPKYQMEYQGNGVHLINTGYRRLGEMHAKAIYTNLSGGQWVPLCPRLITRSSTTVTVQFWVPVGSLVIDTTTIPNQGNGKGFEFYDDGVAANISITNVSVSGDTATLTLASTPTGTGRVRYAYTGTSGTDPGNAGAPRGNIRDSDTATALSGNHLYDWAVTFDEAVGFSFSPLPAGGSVISGAVAIGGKVAM